MSKLLCFLGFHKWVYHRWVVKRKPADCDMLMFVKDCKRCGELKRLKMTEYYRKQNTDSNDNTILQTNRG